MGLWSSFLSWLRSEPTRLRIESVTGLSPSSTVVTSAGSVSFPVGQTVTVKGKLVKVKGLAPIANATVVVTVTPPSGSIWSVNKVTDVNGQFTVSVPLLVAGNYAIKADYAGEANKYKASSASVTITALPAPVNTTMTLVASQPEGTVGDTITVTATLTT